MGFTVKQLGKLTDGRYAMVLIADGKSDLEPYAKDDWFELVPDAGGEDTNADQTPSDTPTPYVPNTKKRVEDGAGDEAWLRDLEASLFASHPKGEDQ